MKRSRFWKAMGWVLLALAAVGVMVALLEGGRRGIGPLAPQDPSRPTVVPEGPPPQPPKTPASATDPQDDVAVQIARLVQGNAAVSAPSTAKEGEPFTVVLRVSKGELASLLAGLRRDVPGPRTVKGEAEVRLSQVMTAELFGYGVEIAPAGKVTQAIDLSDKTDWSWNLRATQSGNVVLDVILSGSIRIDGERYERTFYASRQVIAVDVSQAAFFKRNWQWIVSTLLLPMAVYGFAIWRKRRSPQRPWD